MTFPDVGVQVKDFSALDGVDEVSEVVAATFELFDLLEFFVEGDAVRVRLLNEVSLAAVEDDADLIAFGRIEELVEFFVGGVSDV